MEKTKEEIRGNIMSKLNHSVKRYGECKDYMKAHYHERIETLIEVLQDFNVWLVFNEDTGKLEDL